MSAGASSLVAVDDQTTFLIGKAGKAGRGAGADNDGVEGLSAEKLKP